MNVRALLRKPLVLMGIIYCAVFMFHLRNIFLEPYNAYEIRQWETFAVMRNYTTRHVPFLSPTASQIYSLDHKPEDRYFLLDFPLYPYLASLVAALTGVSFVPARLVNITITAVMSVLLWHIGKRITGRYLPSLLTVLLFNAAAATSFLAVAVQPDMLMLLCLTVSWYFLVYRSGYAFWYGLCCFILTGLLKTYTLPVLFPTIAYIIWTTGKKHYLAYLLLPPLAYGLWIAQKFGTDSFSWWWLPSPQSLFWDRQAYSTSILAVREAPLIPYLADTIRRLFSGGIITVPQLFVAVPGFFALRKTNPAAGKFIALYMAGFVVFFLIFLRGNNLHTYYPLPLIVISSLCTAMGLAALPGLLKSLLTGHRFQQWYRIVCFVLIGAIGLSVHVVLVSTRLATLLRQHEIYRFAASWTERQTVIPEGATIALYHEEASPVFLAMMDRAGWPLKYRLIPCEKHQAILNRLQPDYIVVYSLTHNGPEDMDWIDDRALLTCLSSLTGTTPLFSRQRITVFPWPRR